MIDTLIIQDLLPWVFGDVRYTVEVYKEMSEIDGKKELMARIKRGDSLVGISRFYAVSKKEMVNLIRVWFGAEIADKMERDGRL